MRSGAYTLQETLTAEAASILKHSLGLARRRGHAQITPLHVAATLLSLSSSSLRTACLKSQQQNNHPLQCRALELCFNVALNRLPTITTTHSSSPLLQPHQHVPSLSNALIAALKRAQAHQRRGCIEQNQQQPLLSVKVELDQLILSILDDPSVSRVMREAGFQSVSVKNNLTQKSSSNSSLSVFHSSSSPSLSHNSNHFSSSYGYGHGHGHGYGYGYGSVLFSPQKKPPQVFNNHRDDVNVNLVFDVLLRKKRNTVIIGDTVALTEGLVGELMERFERGEVPDEMKKAHFVKFHNLASVCGLKKEEAEVNVVRVLKRKVSDCVALGGGGGVFYVGDLKWMVDCDDDDDGGGESLSDYLVDEIGKLFGENGNKIWLIATASYQTYMRCQMRIPNLENQWCLQAVPVPSGGLGLSLHSSSVHDSKMSITQNPSLMIESKLFSTKEEHDKLNCCEECASSYEKEAQLFKPPQKSLLPSWLQSHSTETHHKDELTQLKKKWNNMCQCLHQNKQPQNHWNNPYSSNAKIYPYNSSYPYWPNQGSTILPDSSSSISFADSVTKPAYSSNIIPRFRRQQQSSTIEFNFNDEKTQKNQMVATSLDSLKGIMEDTKEVKTTLALGNSTFNDSDHKKAQRDRICKVLQENVPWQYETVSSIAEALVDLKSAKECATWLFLQGNDSVGKKRLALAIAESVCGSVDMLFQLDMLKRENSETPFSEIVVGLMRNHEKFVLLVENADFGDTLLRKMVDDEFGMGKFGTLGQKIFILTNGCNVVSEDQKKDSVMKLVLQISETEKKPSLELSSSSSSSPCLSNKRRAELDLFSKNKNPRIEENEGKNKKIEFSFSRQSSFNNTLDLNMIADEEDDNDDDDRDHEGENSPISSDLTRETLGEHLISNGSLDSIENLFELNETPDKNKETTEMFISKVKRSFEEIYGNVKFSVQDKVIEEIGVGCGGFTNKMFEKWVKEIFQTSLERVNGGGKDGIVFTLCWGGKEDRKWDRGFMGSCLPKNIQIVNYLMD
ncbi:protein SMAX1-LIKE 4-like [Vicia villosa]|uniref:protein SMAX1-LIKE 4-like n=1 Tax=Vicia villosa TaxID=3911 RepID=UPI00273A93C0|nr:protein SMAX1-LIKE 4-like [Vicia villosa]